jgi:GAF domain-containing protein
VPIDDSPSTAARRDEDADPDQRRQAWEQDLASPSSSSGRSPRSRCSSLPAHLGDEVRGRISLQNLDRTNAFTDTDVRLLSTLASGLGVALENARLVHETRQRNAELALINLAQAAIAGELDAQAIYDLVGDKLQEVFDAQVVSIAIYDEGPGF